MRSFRSITTSTLTGLLLLACSSDDPVPQGTPCTGGQVIACACPGQTAQGVQGAQTCQPGGSYGPCSGCPAGAGGTSSGGQASGGAGQGGQSGGASGKGAQGGVSGNSGQGGTPGGQGGQGGAGQTGAGQAGKAGSSGEAGVGGSGVSGSSPSGGQAGQGGGGAAGQAGAGQAGAGQGGAQAGSAQAGAGQGGEAPAGGTSGQGGAGGGVNNPEEDDDQDGWSDSQGDCDDSDPNVNPGAIDLLEVDQDGKPLAAQVDNDCSGQATTVGEQLSCDQGLSITDTNAFDAARALGLCNKVSESSKKWGVIEAGYNRIGAGFLKAPLAVGKNIGLADGFGAASLPREGERLLALSTGEARADGQAGFSNNTCGQSGNQGDSFPPGFPKQGTCGVTGKPYDGVALDFKIRVPTNARSMSFDSRFFSCEFPVYVCQQYNDVFAVLMVPSPLTPAHNMHDPASQSANIAFEPIDANKGNVIGVNNQSFLTACKSGVSGYKNCQGEQDLLGSGFEGHGASSWLHTETPVPPGGIIYLRLAIWDSGDGALDSTVLLDHFAFSTKEAAGVITTPTSSP